MRPFPTHVIASAACLVLAPRSLQAQEGATLGSRQPVDTAAVVKAALAAFRTPNGPIVAVLATLRCDSGCSHKAAEAVIADFASIAGATLVTPADSLPPCRWNPRVPDSSRKGVRVNVSPPVVERGAVTIWVAASCTAGRPAMIDTFGKAFSIAWHSLAGCGVSPLF